MTKELASPQESSFDEYLMGLDEGKSDERERCIKCVEFRYELDDAEEYQRLAQETDAFRTAFLEGVYETKRNIIERIEADDTKTATP